MERSLTIKRQAVAELRADLAGVYTGTVRFFGLPELYPTRVRRLGCAADSPPSDGHQIVAPA